MSTANSAQTTNPSPAGEAVSDMISGMRQGIETAFANVAMAKAMYQSAQLQARLSRIADANEGVEFEDLSSEARAEIDEGLGSFAVVADERRQRPRQARGDACLFEALPCSESWWRGNPRG